jgi:hypothetical protein
MTKLSGVFKAFDFSETIALSQHKISGVSREIEERM